MLYPGLRHQVLRFGNGGLDRSLDDVAATSLVRVRELFGVEDYVARAGSSARKSSASFFCRSGLSTPPIAQHFQLDDGSAQDIVGAHSLTVLGIGMGAMAARVVDDEVMVGLGQSADREGLHDAFLTGGYAPHLLARLRGEGSWRHRAQQRWSRPGGDDRWRFF